MGKTGRIRASTGKTSGQRGNRQTVKWLTKAEIRRFFRAIPRENIRDRLLFNLMYLHGLRRGEAALLTLDNVRNGQIAPPRLKGGRSHPYMLLPSSSALLRRYLAVRGDDPCPYLFRGRRRACAPLSGRTIDDLFRRYATIADLPLDRRHSHVLRHSIGTHMAEEGFDISDVADHLGHSDLSSTQIYFQITDKRRAKNYQRIRRSREIVQRT